MDEIYNSQKAKNPIKEELQESFFTKKETYTKNNHCPKRTGHVMHNKMLLRAKQFSDLLSHSTLITGSTPRTSVGVVQITSYNDINLSEG